MKEKEYKRPHINDWHSFRRYGLMLLTGEACAYMERLLLDVNEDGRKLLADYFSITLNGLSLSPNWNSSVNGKDDAIGSIMLPPEMFMPLARFILYHVEQVDYLVELPGGGVYGYMSEDVPPSEWESVKDYRVKVNWARSRENKQPQKNGRNVHAFSGRTK